MRKEMLKTSLLSLVTAVMLGTTGCSTNPVDDNTVTISGAAVDGYLRNAFICLDIDNSGECDDGEPFAKSSADGTYELSYESALADNATMLVVGGIDNGTGLPFTGLLKAPLDPSATTINITPLTTMVAAQIQASDGDTSDATAIATATQLIANTLGITADDVVSDPVANPDKKVLGQALQIQKAIEVMTLAQTENGTSLATGMNDVALALAKQFKGTDKNVSALIDDIAADTSIDLPAVKAVATAASSMTTKLQTAIDNNVSDIQAAAEMLSVEAETSVQSAFSVDANGTVLVDDALITAAITAIVNKAIDDAAIKTANVTRILSLLGIDSNNITVATQGELEALNITSSTTLEEFKTLIASTTFTDTAFSAELSLQLTLALSIESAIGQEESGSALENKAFWEARFEGNWDNGVYHPAMFATSSHTLSNGTHTQEFFFVEKNGTTQDISAYMNQTGGDDGSYEGYVWDGNSTWVQTNYSDSDNYRINADGTISFYSQDTNTSEETVDAVLKLLATQDISTLNLEVGYRFGDIMKLLPVTFSAGAEQYILEFSDGRNDGIRFWKNTDPLNDYYPTYTDNTGVEHNYTSALELVSYSAENNMSVYAQSPDGIKQFQLSFYYTTGATLGSITAQELTCTTSCTLGTKFYAGTWESKTVDGLAVVTLNTVDSIRQNSYAMVGSTLRYVEIPDSVLSGEAKTEILYNEIAINDIVKAMAATTGLDNLASWADLEPSFDILMNGFGGAGEPVETDTTLSFNNGAIVISLATGTGTFGDYNLSVVFGTNGFESLTYDDGTNSGTINFDFMGNGGPLSILVNGATYYFPNGD